VGLLLLLQEQALVHRVFALALYFEQWQPQEA